MFHVLDCNNSMPIAIKCEDNYKIRAAAIHCFYSLQQITSRKLHMVLWRVLTTADSLQGRFSTVSAVWNFNVQDLTESGHTAVFQLFFFVRWQRVFNCSADEIRTRDHWNASMAKMKSHAIAPKFRNHKNEMEFKPRRAGYMMFVQEFYEYIFRSLTSSHFFNLVAAPKKIWLPKPCATFRNMSGSQY